MERKEGVLELEESQTEEKDNMEEGDEQQEDFDEEEEKEDLDEEDNYKEEDEGPEAENTDRDSGTESKSLLKKLLSGVKTEKECVPGIIYLGHIPPRLRPKHMRNLLSAYGEIGRIFLQPEGTSSICYYSRRFN